MRNGSVKMRRLIGVLDFYTDVTARQMANVTNVLFGRDLRLEQESANYGAAVAKYVPPPRKLD